MTEEKKDHYILAESIEKFKEIEDAYKNFRKNYSLNILSDSRKLIIRENPLVDKDIHIYPEMGKIKEIITIESNLEGRILRSGEGYWVIKLGKNKYSIHSKNPNISKKKIKRLASQN